MCMTHNGSSMSTGPSMRDSYSPGSAGHSANDGHNHGTSSYSPSPRADYN